MLAHSQTKTIRVNGHVGEWVEGFDSGMFEGTSGGKIISVLFENEKVPEDGIEVDFIERPAGREADFDTEEMWRAILSTVSIQLPSVS